MVGFDQGLTVVSRAFAELIMAIHDSKNRCAIKLTSEVVTVRLWHKGLPTDYLHIGDESQMRPLVLAAAYAKVLRGTLQSEIWLQVLDSIRCDEPSFRPIEIYSYAGLAIRYGAAKVVALAAMGITPTNELCSLKLGHIVDTIKRAIDEPDTDIIKLLTS